MKEDCRGVAGFFEDLPVLMFVLAGVASLVLTGTFVSERMSTQREAEELERVADDIVNSAISEMRFARGSDLLPTVAGIRSGNYSGLQEEAGHHGFVLSVNALLPERECIVCIRSGEERLPEMTGYACRLLNAIDDLGICVVLEVSAVVS